MTIRYYTRWALERLQKHLQELQVWTDQQMERLGMRMKIRYYTRWARDTDNGIISDRYVACIHLYNEVDPESSWELTGSRWHENKEAAREEARLMAIRIKEGLSWGEVVGWGDDV